MNWEEADFINPGGLPRHASRSSVMLRASLASASRRASNPAPPSDRCLSGTVTGERGASSDDGSDRMSSFIALLRSVRVGMLLGRGLLTLSRLSATAPLAHREARIQQWACAVLQALGIQVRLQGVIQPGQLLVANHVSWLDVIVLHSLCPQARFVAKADVLRWPLIGRLAQGAGTLFVQRDRPRMAARIVSEVTAVLGSGGTVMVFPEGTTSDGVGVLPFRSSLLQAAFAGNGAAQPLALRYSEGTQPISPSVRYLGDDSLVQSIWWLCRARGVVAEVTALPLRAASSTDRKAFATELRADIEQALTQ